MKILCFLLALLLATPAHAIILVGFGGAGGGAGAAFVQGTGLYHNVMEITIVKAFDTDVTAGNTIIVWARCAGGGAPIVSVADSLGNTYVERVATVTNYKFFEASNINGGACTVTVTLTNEIASTAMVIWEVSGLVNTGAYDTGYTTATSRAGVAATDGNYTNNITTTAAGDFIAAVCWDVSGTQTVAAGTGYTETWRNSTTSEALAEYKIAGGSGTDNATWTPSDTDSYTHHIAAFKAAP